MSFPQTRLTLVERLASGGSAEAWQTFLGDYWGPIRRFALRWGARKPRIAAKKSARALDAGGTAMLQWSPP